MILTEAERETDAARGMTMLLAVVFGLTLAFVGKALLQQWLTGALTEARETPSLSATDFPRLAPSARPARPVHTRPVAPSAGVYLRRAA